ncbi:MAG: hypothetical protein JW708_11235 [Vallitaleaceae bacterium]|nr:hypothetical protein [Vallitaleaceae bacterium]
MKTCKKCQVQILDETGVCPLCNAVIAPDGEAGSNRYPKVGLSLSRFHMLYRIYLFISVITIVTSIIVNYMFYHGVLWFFASIAAIIYSWTIIRHAIRSHAHVASKIMVQAIAGSALIVVIDSVTGFYGWSVNYVIPQIAIFANVAILVLMMIYRMDRRNYLMYQMSMALLGFIPLILLLTRVATRPLASVISIILSSLILLGTVIFGDKTVQSELIRRFHI